MSDTEKFIAIKSDDKTCFVPASRVKKVVYDHVNKTVCVETDDGRHEGNFSEGADEMFGAGPGGGFQFACVNAKETRAT